MLEPLQVFPRGQSCHTGLAYPDTHASVTPRKGWNLWFQPVLKWVSCEVGPTVVPAIQRTWGPASFLMLWGGERLRSEHRQIRQTHTLSESIPSQGARSLCVSVTQTGDAMLSLPFCIVQDSFFIYCTNQWPFSYTAWLWRRVFQYEWNKESELVILRRKVTIAF